MATFCGTDRQCLALTAIGLCQRSARRRIGKVLRRAKPSGRIEWQAVGPARGAIAARAAVAATEDTGQAANGVGWIFHGHHQGDIAGPLAVCGQLEQAVGIAGCGACLGGTVPMTGWRGLVEPEARERLAVGLSLGGRYACIGYRRADPQGRQGRHRSVRGRQERAAESVFDMAQGAADPLPQAEEDGRTIGRTGRDQHGQRLDERRQHGPRWRKQRIIEGVGQGHADQFPPAGSRSDKFQDRGRPLLRGVHQLAGEVGVLEGGALGEFGLVRRCRMAAIDVLVVEERQACILEQFRHLPGMARVDPVVLG